MYSAHGVSIAPRRTAASITQAKAQNTRQSKPPVKGSTPGIVPGANGIRPAKKHGSLIAVGSRIGFFCKCSGGNYRVRVLRPNGTRKVTGKPKGR